MKRGAWLAALLLCMSGALAQTSDVPASMADPGRAAGGRATLRVMLIGNSLIYTNNLPGLVRSLARAQDSGPHIETATYAMPGAELRQHWKNGGAAKALQDGHWDVLVLQERGGVLACLASPSQREHDDCRASARAHRHFVELARAHGTRVVLLGTWGPDGIWQDNLDRGLRQMARETGATPLMAGTRLRDYQAGHRQPPLFTDDSLHPSLTASLIVAAMLYREIAGQSAQPKNLLLDFPLLPPGSRMGDNLPLEDNAALNALAKPVTLDATELPALLQAAENPQTP